MNLRTIMAGSAAAAALIFAAPAVLPSDWNPVTLAQASVSVSISYNTFYRDLSPDGDWVYFHGRYVWVPIDMRPGWRPYMYGHWVWTRQYGWMWVSDERFGWATYHYGRWGYSYDIGWYWVPGTRWAPAWVTWASDNDNIIWAPLPPGSDEYDVDFAYSDFPDYYWNCVPARRFLDRDVSAAVIIDFGQRRRIFADVRPANRLRFENNVAFNAAIDINFVEKRAGRRVQTFDVVGASQPGRAVDNGGQIAVFNGAVAGDANTKPNRIKNVGEVQQVFSKRSDRVTRGNNMPEVLGRPLKNGKVQDNGTQPGTVLNQGNGKKNQKQLNPGNSQPEVITGQPGNGGQPLTQKQLRKLQQQQLQQQQGGQDQYQQPGDQGGGQALTKKQLRKLQQQQQQQQQQGGQDQYQQPGGQGGQPMTKKQLRKLQQQPQGGQQACDPTVDPNCIAQPQ